MAKRQKLSEEVELNLAAMLDMAFQILAFFILTFKPAPVEGQIQIRMPPPQALAMPNATAKAGQDATSKELLKGENTITVVLTATPDGTLNDIYVLNKRIDVDPKLTAFETELKRLLTPADMPYDQLIIQVASKMRYEELMRVLGVCSRMTVHGDPKEHLKLSVVDSDNP
jgi:biopolymer transport protein ExbD